MIGSNSIFYFGNLKFYLFYNVMYTGGIHMSYSISTLPIEIF